MPQSFAEILALLIGFYLLIGLIFGLFFIWRGVAQMDPAAQGGTWGFRLIILPGVVAFWPLLAWRWKKGQAHPPEERNPHRDAASSA